MIEIPLIPAHNATPGWEPDSSTTITRNGVPLLVPEIGEILANTADGTAFIVRTTGEPKEIGRAHARVNGSGAHVKARRLNFIEGANVSLAIALDAITDEIDVTIAATGGSATWGSITGTIASQTDLKNAAVTPPAADPSADTIQEYLDHLATTKTNATQAILPLGGLLINGAGSSVNLGSVATLSPGTNAAALNGLSGVADRGVHFTGAGAMALHVLTSLARDLLDDANTNAMQTTLGATSLGRTLFTATTAQAAWDALCTGLQTIASAATVDLSSSQACVDITGTTNISTFTIAAGRVRILRFNGVLTITHDLSVIACPGNASIATANGDICFVVGTGTNRCRIVGYTRAASQPWSGSGFATTVTEQTDAAGWRTQIEAMKDGRLSFGQEISGSALRAGGTFVTEWIAPRAGSIGAWRAIADANVTCTWEVEKTTYAAYPASFASIRDVTPPTISTQKNTDATLTGWTKTFNAGDVIRMTATVTAGSTADRLLISFAYDPT